MCYAEMLRIQCVFKLFYNIQNENYKFRLKYIYTKVTC